MRIKGFSYYLEGHLEPHKLNNSTVVIDGQNMFFPMYKNSKLTYAFGCESDGFAKYVRTYIEKFQKANVKCYFVFKGGHEDKEKLDKHFEAQNRLHGRDYKAGYAYDDDIVKPLFTKDIWFQVLDEMGLDYVICNEDFITECIALARKLSCPVISFNVQYFFSSVQYIPEPSIVLDENGNLKCGIISRSSILNKINLTEKKMILLIMLADQHIFDESVYMEFFRRNKIPLGNIKRLNALMRWLARFNEEQAQKEIFKFLSRSDQETFAVKKNDLENLLLRREKTETKMVVYIADKDKAEFTQSDPDWFEKGVFFNHVAIPYVNLYKFKIVKASNMIEDYEQENSIMLSLDIVKYAFDLLTNFEGHEILVEHRKSVSDVEIDQSFKYRNSVRKPDYEAVNCVFENGWDNIKQLKLFQHFLIETFESFDFDRLDGVPADTKLFLIALLYFSRKKPEVQSEIYSILLCHVILGVVCEKKNDDCNESIPDASDKPFLDSLIEKNLVTATDCNIAWSIMREYFNIRQDELRCIFNRRSIHPLVEFQRCLQELNYLNQLCGLPFDATVYSKTYNGTFVYRILCSMKNKDVDSYEYIKNKLNPAPTVLAFFSGLLETYKSIMYEF